MARPTIPMPGPVKATFGGGFVLVALLLYFTVELIELGLAVFVVLLFLALLARGHPLGWQGMRMNGLLTTLASIPFVVYGFTQGFFVLPLLFMTCGFVIVNGLSGKEAALYCDLYCGHCQSTEVRPRGFWFQGIECRKCHRKWKPHSSRVDESAFD